MNEPAPQESLVLFDAEGRIASALSCHACGHDIRTIPVEGPCPQCERPVVESLAGLLPVLDETGCVVTDVPCVNCGYNLRTRPAPTLCPKCGSPVAKSLRGHYLNQAPPSWVRRVASGATLLLVASTGTIAMYVLGICGGVLLGLSRPAAAVAPPIAFTIVLWVLGLGVTVVMICGLVYLTTPDPTMQFKREGLSARRLLRHCLLLAPLAFVGSIIAAAVQGFAFGPALSPLPIILSLAGTVAYVVIPLATLRHLAMLMRRVPRLGLVTFTKIEFWGLLLTGGIYVCSTTAVMVLTFWTMAPAMPAGMGPNTPTAGPNALAPATNSVSQLATLGYVTTTTATPTNVLTAVNTSSSYQVDPNGIVAVSTVGPGGVTSTTTMPASAPFPVGAMPEPALMIGSILMGAGGCGMFGFAIAGFVLLILARNALAGAARQAENNAGLIPGGSAA